MSNNSWIPDIVVGVDFGMTCTGVAYSSAPDWPEPRAIQRWSGRLGSQLRNKVPSVLAYARDSKRVVNWGSQVEYDDENVEICDMFKLNLDDNYKDDNDPYAPSAEEARCWFQDYLRCLHHFIVEYFERTTARFDERKVEYIFSTPTTWTSPSMIAAIEKTIKQAGFADRSNSRVKMGLTEAEAAAVFVSKNSHEKDDVIMVCDIGGGTTDVNILKVQDVQSRQRELKQLCCVEGSPVGSGLIDFKIKDIIKARLDMIRGHLSQSPKETAEIMMHERFETFKCSFGSDASDMPVLHLPVPGLERKATFPEADVFNAKLELSRDDVKRLFDDNIEKIFALIEEQVKVLQRVHPSETISYLILSGGMGSSPYVQKTMRARYEGRIGEYANAASAKILTAQEPQLAVVLGLVSERVQEVDQQTAVYSERCARNSYGVLCKELYDENKHVGEDVFIDPRDRKKWVESQICWLIKKGQTVSTERGIERSFDLKVDMDKTEFVWQNKVVMSHLPPHQLPRSLSRQGARSICTVLASIKTEDMMKHNHRWYNRGQPYRRLELKVRVLIGAADLRFQIHTTDGKRLSKEHKAIEVRWDPPKEGKPNPDYVDKSAMIERANLDS